MISQNQLLPLVTIIVIATSCVGALVGLQSSSFWTDELFTAYFADPAVPTFGAALSRALEDVNPPGYYLVLWQFLSMTGVDFVVGSRGFSAVMGCLSVLAILFAPNRGISLSARCVAGACAATSTVWFYYTQEARSYAFLFLAVTAMLADRKSVV